MICAVAGIGDDCVASSSGTAFLCDTNATAQAL
ncbi:hypothetical protein MTO96_040725, partial [Rhipicephalus appendiculatus]